MNNVSLQLQQYRALKAQETLVVTGDNVLERHPEENTYFRQLMLRWQTGYKLNPMAAPQPHSADAL